MAIEAITTRNSKFNFPKLMVYSTKYCDTIVLMLNEYGKGNGIATNSITWLNNMQLFYETSEGWKIEEFTDYNEVLTLKNK